MMDRLAKAVDAHGIDTIAHKAHVDRRTIERALAGHDVRSDTRRKLSRILADPAERKRPVWPRPQLPSADWSIERIREARLAQLRGDFREPARLAEIMRTDDAMFVAYSNRIAPHSALSASLVPAADTVRAVAAQRSASRLVTVPRTVVAGVNGTLANHGVAFLVTDRTVSDDGTEVSYSVREWPIEHVRWDWTHERYVTRVRDGIEIPIVHGDGTWAVVAKHGVRPFASDACLLPAAMVWATHAHGLLDWAATARAHGRASLLGMLGEGIPTHDSEDNLTPEAKGLLTVMQDVASGDGVGILPEGASAEFLHNGSSAWQVFDTLASSREKAAARIYLGTDGTLGSVGGAPGVDIATLFGVATTKLQGDLEAITSAIRSGVYVPWTVEMFGDERLAPRLEYALPDPDQERTREERHTGRIRLAEVIAGMREQRLDVTQEVVDRIAADLGVSPAPRLAASASPDDPGREPDPSGP
jgi:hypothetical protein